MEDLEVRCPIKLVQFIKLAGWCDSGAEAGALISAGHVTVDGKVQTGKSHQLVGGEVVAADTLPPQSARVQAS